MLPFDQSLTETVQELEAGLPPHPDSGFLGSRLSPDEARLHIITAPWDVTTSYRDGTSNAPEAIRLASHQMDAEDGDLIPAYHHGIALLPADSTISEINQHTRRTAKKTIAALERGMEDPVSAMVVNRASERFNQIIERQATEILDAGKFPALLGGDHSCPYGLIRALGRHYDSDFGILHLDAHHDLRQAYEGFAHSHASIFYNVLESCRIPALTQVGIRDYSREESRLAKEHAAVTCFYQTQLFAQQAEGKSWQELCAMITDTLPARIYISLDIDVLEPTFCPATGTPVPGGMDYQALLYLLRFVSERRQIIGFDLCETGDAEWDANVGARLLYALCGALFRSHQSLLK